MFGRISTTSNKSPTVITCLLLVFLILGCQLSVVEALPKGKGTEKSSNNNNHFNNNNNNNNNHINNNNNNIPAWTSIYDRRATFIPHAPVSSNPSKRLFTRSVDEGGIPDQYIIKFRFGSNQDQVQSVLAYLKSSSDVENLRQIGDSLTYLALLKKPAIDYLLASPVVEFVEQDSKVKVKYFPSKTNHTKTYEEWRASSELKVDTITSRGKVSAQGLLPEPRFQDNAPWNLDRVDQRTSDLDEVYKYIYNGTGVHIYVIDTGIRTTHLEFTGRIGNGVSVIPGTVEDCNGHGTHVSGTAAGTIFGAAKAATIHPVRTLDCNGEGSVSDVINAIQWVISNFQSPAVAVMSLGGTVSSALDTVVSTAVRAGIAFSVAAGNEDQDACFSSPARNALVATIAASDIKDTKADFSNYGSCVDIFAPGVDITSAWDTGDNIINTISGTSMAAPLAAGLLARLREFNPSLSPDALNGILTCSSTKQALSDVPSSTPNALAFFAISQPVVSGSVSDNTVTAQCNIDSNGNLPVGSVNSGAVDAYGCYYFQHSITVSAPSKNLPTPYYTTTFTGIHRGYLSLGGNSSITFDAVDLILYQLNNATNTWDVVAASTKTTNNELIVYYGSPGIYTFEVRGTPLFLAQSSFSSVTFDLIVKPPNSTENVSAAPQCNINAGLDGSSASETQVSSSLLLLGTALVSLFVSLKKL